ncbi:MAG: response regulator transcription factor [Hyphomicrobiaceae bacterium]|nr:response regulator transcription factor [Hyphomicrobiaceae bacterium]
MAEHILVVEDHPLYADALKAILRNAFPTASLAAAHSIATARAEIERRQPTLILLDLWLPDTHGLEGLIALRSSVPRVPIVVVSGFTERSVIDRTLLCGATAFISKSCGKDRLVAALVEAVAGNQEAREIALDPDLRDPDARVVSKRVRSLTRQQLRVLEMLCLGKLNKQIAHELEVGETTVKAHVGEVLRKLSVSSRTQAVVEVSKLDFGAMMFQESSSRD